MRGVPKNNYDDVDLDGETAIDDERYDENINERSADNSAPFDDDEEQDSEDEDAQMDYDVDEADANND